MSELPHDSGVIQVLLERLETLQLPRTLYLKEKVDRGEPLDSHDVEFLEEVFADAKHIWPLVARHPEYEQLVARVTHLYKEITTKAAENESKHPG